MTDPPILSFDLDPGPALTELCRLLRFAQGEFTLIVAVCNAAEHRQILVKQLRQRCPIPFQELTLDPKVDTLFSTLHQAIGDPPPAALMVYGLEAVQDMDSLLVATNQIREEFRQFPFPLVLWLTDHGQRHLIRTAPDFYTWASTVHFPTPPTYFQRFLDELIASVWQQVLTSQENRFLSTAELGLTPGSPRCQELETSLAALHQAGIALSPSQAAALAFVRGRIADNNTDQARYHYEASLTQWQALADRLDPPPHSLENVGHLQFYLGLWWRNRSVRDRREFESACQTACDYFAAAVATLTQAHCPEATAKYVNYWAEALHRLEQWDTLALVAQQALDLHKSRQDPIRQARALGFLAEVALHHKDWPTAQTQAQTALQLIDSPTFSPLHPSTPPDPTFLDWVNRFHRSWYLFSLGKAQCAQGQIDAAVATLEQATATTQPEYDPQLYSLVLGQLRQGYFQQGRYLDAFQTRRRQEAIESRFNFRAFVGAGRLQPKQTVANPALPADALGQDAIVASGRKHDVKRLVHRLAQDEFTLTIIYGPSGVGKSSLLEAGLVPALEQERWEGRRVLPLRLRDYGNWAKDLAEDLQATLLDHPLLGEARGGATPPKPSPPSGNSLQAEPTPPSGHSSQTDAVLDLIRQQTQRNRVLVLIFDQFEEFFFECDQPGTRHQFYQFLRQSLTTPFVKVVLSLREDYIHYLLEWQRLVGNLAIIDNNILDKKWLYYLGNFTPTEAKTVITDLTEPTPYVPAVDLVEQVVADLAAEAGEVRPIELQIVGAQLQATGISTLAAYQTLGPSAKASLVQQYLADVVFDCGPVEHQRLADLVLYLLTDDKGTRPRKTKANLAQDLRTLMPHTNLDEAAFALVLDILTQSGLVIYVPEAPEDRYQLVHDYLAAFIRSAQQPPMAQLTQERQKRITAEQQRSEEQKKREAAEQKQLRRTRLAALGLGVLATISSALAVISTVQQRKALIEEVNSQVLAESLAMKAYLQGGLEEAAVIQSMQTGQLLNGKQGKLLTQNIRFQAISSIRAVVYGVREKERLIGHNGEVLNAIFSPDGQIVATTSNDQTARLWNLQGKELKALRGHTASVKSIAFSPDGKILATASYDQTAKLWNLQGDELNTLEGHDDKILEAVFSPDGKILATASYDQTVKLWNLQGDELNTLDHTEPVKSIAFSPNGKDIATADGSGTVKLWNLQGNELKTFKSHNDDINTIVFSPSGEMLAISSRDEVVQLFNLQGDRLKTLNGHGAEVKSITFSSDGRTIATASVDNTVKLWDKLGNELLTLKGHSSPVNSVAFHPEGNILITASDDQSVKIWNWQGNKQKTLVGHDSAVKDVSFSPDGRTLASASADTTVKLWNTLGKEVLTIRVHSDPVNSVAFSPDGEIIATASEDGTVKLWSIQGRELLHTLKGHDAAVKSVNFSPDGQLVVTSGYDKTVRIWNTNGEELRSLSDFTNVVTSAAFSPGQTILAAASWDSTVRFFVDRSVDYLAPEITLRILPGAAVNNVLFSPDGLSLATANWDNQVKLWNLKGEEIIALKGHSGPVYNTAFRPDGQILATASGDNTVKLWDLQGKELQTLEGHSAAVNSLAFNLDGDILVTASEDSTLKLWNFQLEDLIAKGCNWLHTYFIKQSPELLVNLDICQDNDPSVLALAAPLLVDKGEELALKGDSNQAIEFLRTASDWDTSLELDPEVRVRSLVKVQELLTEVSNLVITDQSSIEKRQTKLSEIKQLTQSGISQSQAESHLVPDSNVKQFQRLLIQAEFLPSTFVVTGIYDVYSQLAVLDFQRANDLPATGIVDANTRRVLFRSSALATNDGRPMRVVVVTDGEPTLVFDGPGTEFQILRSVDHGSIVHLTGETFGNWSELLDGGWIFTSWLEPI